MNIYTYYISIFTYNTAICYLVIGRKKNNIYMYTLTLSCKHAILDKRLCKYFTCEYVYTMKASDE